MGCWAVLAGGGRPCARANARAGWHCAAHGSVPLCQSQGSTQGNVLLRGAQRQEGCTAYTWVWSTWVWEKPSQGQQRTGPSGGMNLRATREQTMVVTQGQILREY